MSSFSLIWSCEEQVFEVKEKTLKGFWPYLLCIALPDSTISLIVVFLQLSSGITPFIIIQIFGNGSFPLSLTIACLQLLAASGSLLFVAVSKTAKLKVKTSTQKKFLSNLSNSYSFKVLKYG